MDIEMMSETLGFHPQLTRPVAREEFIDFSRREIFKSCIITYLLKYREVLTLRPATRKATVNLVPCMDGVYTRWCNGDRLTREGNMATPSPRFDGGADHVAVVKLRFNVSSR
jgi:hypothetical protein